MNRIIVGKNPVLIDAYAARLLGYDPNEISYIGISERLGIGTADLSKAEIIEMNQPPENDSVIIKPSARFYEGKVTQDRACSACYGSLLFALERFKAKNALADFPEIHIGQGFRGKSGIQFGIGSCTANYAKHLPGCPPTAKEIFDFIDQLPSLAPH